MSSVSSLSSSPYQQPNFKSRNFSQKFLETVKNMKSSFSRKKLPSEQRILERLYGANYAMQHNHSLEELQETVIRETAAGNMDFVKGINNVLAQNAAKDTYKKV